MPPRVSIVALINRDDGASCSNNAWDCLTTTSRFGIIFSIVIVILVSTWTYWYTVIRPRQERNKKENQDIELDLGNGHTFIITSGPYQRAVVVRGAASTSPPPPAYRPPTPGRGPLGPSDPDSPLSPQPSPRVSRTQIWPPPPHGVASQTASRDPRHPAQSFRAACPPSFQLGMPLQPQPAPMYPPQFMVPGPPPPPPVMITRPQPPLFAIVPPPPPPPPVPPAQRAVLPHPPPRIKPVKAGNNPQPPKPDNPRQPRVPSPGHASTIEDEESDRGGSLSPARRRSPSRSPAREQGRRRKRNSHRARSPSPSRRQSPSHELDDYRGRQRSRSPSPPPRQDRSLSAYSTHSDSSTSRSYRSSTSLDSELRSGLEDLIERAERRKRVREAERLQTLVDRYDREEQEAQGDRAGVDGHVSDTSSEAEPARRTATKKVQRSGTQRSHREDEADDTDDEHSEPERPRRRVTFHQPSLEVLESRVGRQAGSPSSSEGRPTREDMHHGQSRVGRRRCTPSPDERIVERPVATTLGTAESRIGRPRRPSPTREHVVSQRDHRVPHAGDSRIRQRSQRRAQAPPPMETSPQEADPTYKSPPAPHGGHPTVDDGLLLNVPRAVGPPSSTGATCGNGSQASEGSRTDRRRITSHYRRDRETRGHPGPSYPAHYRDRRQWNPPSPEEDSDDDEINNKQGKRGWVSRLASFLPMMARLATNNPAAREPGPRTGVDIGAWNLRKSTAVRAHYHHDLLLLAFASDERRIIQTTLAGEDHARQGLQTTPLAAVAARARLLKSAQRACSSPLSTPPSISQKRLLSRRWTEYAPERVVLAARRMEVPT
ncbi:hypothetical protein VSDG_06191 [Cytospora chrysosperma]|uniref:Uncharacterized protein n=1 Tax=Cytospora chrysosperma TaxID=252740 RepID=A0A423VU93_CYTCH|nr:hypothetical protein VSDG_06191 [Valsa sordida]